MTHNARVEEATYLLYAAVAEVAKVHGIQWMVAGAGGRILLLENVYGLPRGKATEDVDFAVMVVSWEQYQTIVAGICEDGRFTRDPGQRQRIRGPEQTYLDLIPFGGVETDARTIRWPPDNDFVMSVQGFREACDDAVQVIVNNKLYVPVISPVGLMLLKLVAWRDRHQAYPGRDAADIAYLLRHFSTIETVKGLFDHHYDAVEQAGYDIDLAAAYVLGRRTNTLVSADTREQLLVLLEDELQMETDSRLVYEIAQALPGSGEDRSLLLLGQFQAGLLGGKD